MKKKALAFAAAVCATGLLLSGCGASNSGDAASNDGIITAYGCEPQNPLIPGNTNETCGGNPIDMLFAKLVAFDADGNAENEVAESIEPNEDNTEYTVTLKDGWTFTDGTPVTSESFTKAWSYVANAANGLVNSGFFNIIEGYEALQDTSLTGDEQLSGLTVVDDTTFTVKLVEPSSAFPIQVGYTAFAPLPESFYDDPEAFGENPVGNGQYKLDHWTHDSEIALVKNDDYKGVQPAQNNGVTFKVYTDVEAGYADVQAGNLDVMETVPSSATATFETDTTVQAYNEAGSVIQTFTFPSDLEHFADDEEGHLRRQAISRAIDRQNIVDKVLNGVGTAATDFTAPAMPGYSDSLEGSEVLTYDADAAKELWEQANAINAWDNDTDKLTIAYNADGGAKPIYDAIVNSITNALGITCETNPIATFSEFRESISNRTMESAFRTGWQPDYPSAENYLKPLYSSSAADGNGSNDGDYKNPEFDALISQAASAADTESANALYQQAEQILFEDMPAVPLYYSNANGVAALGVNGLDFNWKNLPVYYQLTK